MKRSIAILLTLLVIIFSVHAGGQSEGPGERGRGPGYGGIAGFSYNNVQSDYKMVWRGFEMNTASLLKAIGATNSEATLLLRQIQTNALFLEIRWNAWFNSHIQRSQYLGDDYLVSLRADNRLLTNLKKEKDGQKALDLEIKADNCRHSKDGLGKEIKVKVHTKAGENEVGGYQVFYVPKGMLDVKSAHVRFPRQSSPTDQQIFSPGAYAMWVAKKGFTSEPTTLRIGGRGETHIEVDIAVPAE